MAGGLTGCCCESSTNDAVDLTYIMYVANVPVSSLKIKPWISSTSICYMFVVKQDMKRLELLEPYAGRISELVGSAAEQNVVACASTNDADGMTD